MKIRLLLNFCLLAWGTAYGQNTIAKQTPGMNPIAGTYSLISVDNLSADGSRVHLYGDHPHGILIMDDKGNYSLQIVNENRPKFATGDKSKGTDEENKLAIQGFNAHFGTYSVDTGKHKITFYIQYASFPNWEGTKQIRTFEFDGKVFKYTVPKPTTGGSVTGEVVWKRVE
jgi:hypothetical protein